MSGAVAEQTVFVLKNYNRFLIGSQEVFRWDDFYIHRFKTDFKRLLKFNSPQEAQEFLDKHPEIEDDFDAWIVETTPSYWQ